MAIVYTGSRLMGYSHEGSFAYGAKSYLERMDTEEKDRKDFITDKNNLEDYTAESLKEYQQTGDISVLKSKVTGTAPKITGQSGTRFDRITGQEVPVYKIGSGDSAFLAIQGANGELLDLNSSEVRNRFEIVNPAVHDPNKIRDSFQTSLTNQVAEINRTIDDDEAKLDFSTEQLAGEAEALYTNTRNTFGMNVNASRTLKREVIAAQKDYLEAMKLHMSNPSENRKPTSLEGYYNKRVIKLKTKGIISFNDVKNTDPEKLDVLEQTLMNAAVQAGGDNPQLVVKTYRDLWKDGKETWNKMKSKGRFTADKTEGYDPFIAWMQAVAVGDETALKLEDPSNMKK